MIQFSYDEKTYRRMSARVGLLGYAIIFGTLIVAYGVLMGIIISNWVKEGSDLITMLIGIILSLGVLAALIVVMIIAIRKQFSKSFTMYSANGVVLQGVEITDEELVVNNLSRQNVTRINRRDIASVKKYKTFFVVVTNAKVKWAVPFDGQTQLLYDVLTGKASVTDLPAKANEPHDENVAETQRVAEQVVAPAPSDALSFEYQLTEQQAINMLTKVITSRLRVVLIGMIITSLLTLVVTATVLVEYFTVNAVSTSRVIFIAVFALLTAFCAITYGNKNKSGRISGGNYFNQQSKDGKCVLRIELYNQGIVSVNVLRDTRVYFRISDMLRIKMFNDFFLVEFKSQEVLPIPLNEDTRKLYDILNNGVQHSQHK